MIMLYLIKKENTSLSCRWRNTYINSLAVHSSFAHFTHTKLDTTCYIAATSSDCMSISNANCYWSDEDKCISKDEVCSNIGVRWACTWIYDCLWNADAQEGGASCYYPLLKASATVGTASSFCDTISKQTACDVTDSCIWVGDKCMSFVPEAAAAVKAASSFCDAISEQTTCDKTDYCIWMGDECMSFPRCMGNGSGGSDDDKSKWWSCATKTSVMSCNRMPQCKWSVEEQTCLFERPDLGNDINENEVKGGRAPWWSCASIPTKDRCTGLEYCAWNPLKNVCQFISEPLIVSEVSESNSKENAEKPVVKVEEKKAPWRSCAFADTQAKCDVLSLCEWNKKTNECEWYTKPVSAIDEAGSDQWWSCQSMKDELACKSIELCDWNSESSACHQYDQPIEAQKKEENNTPWWSCDILDSELACKSIDVCDWNVSVRKCQWYTKPKTEEPTTVSSPVAASAATQGFPFAVCGKYHGDENGCKLFRQCRYAEDLCVPNVPFGQDSGDDGVERKQETVSVVAHPHVRRSPFDACAMTSDKDVCSLMRICKWVAMDSEHGACLPNLRSDNNNDSTDEKTETEAIEKIVLTRADGESDTFLAPTPSKGGFACPDYSTQDSCAHEGFACVWLHDRCFDFVDLI